MSLFREAKRRLQRVGTTTRRAGGEEGAVGGNVQRSLATQLQAGGRRELAFSPIDVAVEGAEEEEGAGE